MVLDVLCAGTYSEREELQLSMYSIKTSGFTGFVKVYINVGSEIGIFI